MKSLNDAGFNTPQMAKVNQLALKADKPLEDVIKMRTEDKMGWGKIAKELGVHPSELGHSVSSLRHELNVARKNKRADKRAGKHADKADKRMAKHADKADKRMAKHADKADKRMAKREAKAEKRMERKSKRRGRRK